MGFCINWKLDNICYFSVYQSNLKNNWKQEFWSLLILLLEFMLSRNGLNLSLSLSTLSVVLIQSVDYGSRSSDSCCYGAAYSAIQHCVPGGTFMHHNTYSLHPWIISQYRFSNMIPRVLYSSLSLIMLVQLNTVR